MDFVFRIMDIPPWYYVIAVAAAIVLVLCKRKWSICLLLPYLFLIVAITILIRQPMAQPRFIIQPFWSYTQWDKQSAQVLSNIFMFIPVGFLTANLWSWKAILYSAGLSAAIELTQYFTRRGYCEFDDIFHNTFGAFFGTLFYFAISLLIQYFLQRRNSR